MTTRPTAPSHYARKGNFTEGPITRHLIAMSAPMTWGIFAIVSFQLVDMFFISMLGTRELAAVSFTLPVTMTFFSLFLGLAIGTASVLARAIGGSHKNGDDTEVVRLTTHALYLALLVGVIMAAVGLVFADGLFRAMGAGDDMLPIIHDYMTIWFAGALFLTTPLVANSALRASGHALFPAIVMTVAALANAVVSPVLIFGLLGFPALGVLGAALGTLVANIGSAGAALYMLWRLKMIRIRRYPQGTLRDSWRRILMIALPAGITNTIQPATNGFLLSLLAAHSTAAVAAFGIAARVEAFAFVVIMGLAGGMAPIIGQNWGAGRYDRVDETLRKAITFNVVWSLTVAALLALFARPLAGVFTDDPQIIAIAALFFLTVPFSYAAGNLVPGWASAFNAVGTPQRAAAMIFIKHILVLIPAALIGGHIAGVHGIFAAIAGTNVVIGLAVHIYSRKITRGWIAAPAT